MPSHQKKSVIFLLTNVDRFPGKSGKKTGWYLPELAHPLHVAKQHNFDITFATPDGGAAPLDPGSEEQFKSDPVCQQMLNDSATMTAIRETRSLKTLKMHDYAGVFIVGGHGPMFDLAEDTACAQQLVDLYTGGGIIAAVCHGPAALVNCMLSPGEPLVSGKKLTCFTDAEEELSKLSGVVPFPLETKLRELGAEFQNADPWKECVVKDDRLITGQNPASATGCGMAFAKAVEHHAPIRKEKVTAINEKHIGEPRMF